VSLLVLLNHVYKQYIFLFFCRKNYEEPHPDEGFDEIVGVNFVPHFQDEELKKLYHQYLVA